MSVTRDDLVKHLATKAAAAVTATKGAATDANPKDGPFPIKGDDKIAAIMNKFSEAAKDAGPFPIKGDPKKAMQKMVADAADEEAIRRDNPDRAASMDKIRSQGLLAQGELAKLQKAMDTLPADAAARTDLEKRKADLTKSIQSSADDLRVLEDLGASAAKVNAILNRNSLKGAETAPVETSGIKQDGGKVTASSSKAQASTGPGYLRTTTATSSASVDDKGISAKKETAVSTGNAAGLSDTHSTSTSAALDSSGLNVTRATGDKHESPAGTTERNTSTTAGTGGILHTQEDKTRAKSATGETNVRSTSSTVGVNAGAGGLGPTATFTQSDGKVKAPKTGEEKDKEDARFRDPGAGDPKPTSSTEIKSTFGAGLVSGPDGTGLGAHQSSSYDYKKDDLGEKGRGGVRVGPKESADGSWTYTITEDPNTLPPTYTMVVKIRVGGTVGASGGGDFNANSGVGKGGATVGVEASGSGWTTRTYTGLKSDSDVKQIEKNLCKAAKAPLTAGDPDAVLQLPDGDSVEVGAQGGGKISGGASGSSGSTSVGFDASTGDTRSIAVKGQHTGKGTVTLSVTPTETTSGGFGGSVGSGAVGWSGHHDSSHTDTDVYTFTIRIEDDEGKPIPGAKDVYNQIEQAHTRAELDALVAAHPELHPTHTTGTDDATSDANKMNVALVSGGVTSSADEQHQASIKDGHRTDTYTASNDTKIDVSVAGRNVFSADRGEDSTEVVRDDNTMTGSVGEHSSDTDYGTTASNLASKKGLFGAATSGQVPLASTTESTGLDLTDADFRRIMATAKDTHAWQEANGNTDIQEDWIRCRNAIRSAGDDRNAVAKAINDFVGKEHPGRALALENVIRPPGEATGGSRYDWPGSLAAEKAQYASLVLSDGLAWARQLQGQGKYDDAFSAAAHAESGLTHLTDVLNNPPTPFTNDAARAEMLEAVGKKRAEAQGFAARVQALKAEAGHAQEREQKLRDVGVVQDNAHGDPMTMNIPPEQQTQSQKDALTETDQQAAADDAEARAAEAKAKATADFARFQPSLDAYLKQQDTAFGTADTEMNKKESILHSPDPVVIVNNLNKLRDEVYPEWDKLVAEAEEAATAAGEDPSKVGPRPAHDWLKHEYDRFNGMFPEGGS